MNQWVNLATSHFQGRATKWLKGIGVPWQILNWNQLCSMVVDRFSEVNAHDAVEQLQNMREGGSSISQYIDKFEECMALVKRDHPYIQ